MSQRGLQHCSRMKEVVGLLEENGEMTTSELADEMNTTTDSVRSSIRYLRNRDRVESEVRGKGHEKTHWLIGGFKNDLSENQKKVVEYLQENGDSTGEEIAEGTGLDSGCVRRKANSLERRGIVVSRPNPLDPRGMIRELSDEVV